MFYFPSSIAGGEKRAGAVCRAGNSRKRVLDRRASSLGFSGALKPPREGRGRGAMGKINCLSEREELVPPPPPPLSCSVVRKSSNSSVFFCCIPFLFFSPGGGGTKRENGVLVPLVTPVTCCPPPPPPFFPGSLSRFSSSSTGKPTPVPDLLSYLYSGSSVFVRRGGEEEGQTKKSLPSLLPSLDCSKEQKFFPFSRALSFVWTALLLW